MERVDVEQRAEKARRFFLEGYNCAQAVVLAYCDLFDISPSLAASISCLLYTSPSPRDLSTSRMPSSA